MTCVGACRPCPGNRRCPPSCPGPEKCHPLTAWPSRRTRHPALPCGNAPPAASGCIGAVSHWLTGDGYSLDDLVEHISKKGFCTSQVFQPNFAEWWKKVGRAGQGRAGVPCRGACARTAAGGQRWLGQRENCCCGRSAASSVPLCPAGAAVQPRVPEFQRARQAGGHHPRAV